MSGELTYEKHQVKIVVRTGFEPVTQVSLFTVRNYPTDLCEPISPPDCFISKRGKTPTQWMGGNSGRKFH